jgi:hypothetical protein
VNRDFVVSRASNFNIGGNARNGRANIVLRDRIAERLPQWQVTSIGIGHNTGTRRPT